MKVTKIYIAVLAVAVVLSAFDISSAQTRRTRTPARSTGIYQNTNISGVDISSGLKAAIFQGVESAIDSLGREHGFLNNARVRIPLPNSLQKLEKGLRFAGQGDKVDDFIVAMNDAASSAVPVAADIFFDSVKQMSFSDARNILFSGQDDAATQFFRRTSENRLRRQFRPIVEDFTAEVGVTQQYKALIGKYGLFGRIIGQDASDIDGYITEKALDGLFLLVADEEKRIRRDPIGRTTSILQKVFGVLR